MNKILEKLTQEDIEHLNRSIGNKETYLAIKKLPTKKIPVPDGFTG